MKETTISYYYFHSLTTITTTNTSTTTTTTTCGLWSRSGQNDWECLDIPELVSLFDYSGSAQATDDSSNSSSGGSESLIIF